jgi:hypothetical protein
VSKSRNHAWAGSLAVRRCQAIETMAAWSIGSGRVVIAVWAPISWVTQPSLRLGENRVDIASAVEHPNDFRSVSDDPIENDVRPDGE